jgi:hypothetical protein
MADQSRPYAIHSDNECDRLEKQARIAGSHNHLRHVPVPEMARDPGRGMRVGRHGALLGAYYSDASVIGVDIREDYLAYARQLAKDEGLRKMRQRLRFAIR